MAKRPCLGIGGQPCPHRALTDRSDHRCTACAGEWHRQRDARRGTARQRGYDAQHDATRAALLPHAYGKPCPRCDQPMLRGQDLDLGHSTARALDPHSRGDRIEHAACNRGAGDHRA